LSHDNVAAEPYLREALRICRERHDEKLAGDVLTDLGTVLREKQQFTESLAMYREALDLYRKYEGEEGFRVSSAWLGVANNLANKGDLEGWDDAYTHFLNIRRKILTIKDPTVQNSQLRLADIRLRRREYARAAELLLELHNALKQPDNVDPERKMESIVTQRLIKLYKSWGKQQETEHWRGAWAELMRDRAAKLSAQIAGKKDDAALFRARAGAYSSLGEFDKASSDLTTAISLDPLDYEQWLHGACVLAYLKDTRAFNDHCQSMVDRFKGRRCAAQCCLLVPESPVELKVIIDAADSAAASEEGSIIGWSAITKGLAEFRRGRYEQAIDWAAKGRDANHEPEEKIEAQLIIAMANHKLGRNDQAQAAFAEAADQIDKDLPHLGTGENIVVNWLVCHILFREAKDLIRAPAPP